jgi:hypothetical protein
MSAKCSRWKVHRSTTGPGAGYDGADPCSFDAMFPFESRNLTIPLCGTAKPLRFPPNDVSRKIGLHLRDQNGKNGQTEITHREAFLALPT